MKPDWKQFVDSLITYFQYDRKTSWGKIELVQTIKDRKIEFLERCAEDILPDDDVPF